MKKTTIGFLVSGLISTTISANPAVLFDQFKNVANSINTSAATKSLLPKNAVQSRFDQKWFFKTNEPFAYGLFAKDGKFYFPTSNSLTCLNSSDGKLNWSFPGQDYAMVGLDASETILYVLQGKYTNPMLLAIQNDGKLKWRFKIENFGFPVARMSKDKNTIYIYSPYGVIALDSSGKIKWIHAQHTDLVGEVNGLVYSVDTLYKHMIKALDAGNGTVKWSRALDKELDLQTSVVFKKDTIYLIPSLKSGGSRLYALSTMGEEKWSYDFKNYHWVTILDINHDGLYILASDMALETKLILLGFDKKEKWSLSPFKSQAINSAVVEPDGSVYLSTGYEVFAINKWGQIDWDYHSKDFVTLAGIYNGSLYTFGRESVLTFNPKTGDPELGYLTRDLITWMKVVNKTVYFGNYSGVGALTPNETFQGKIQ